MQDFTGDAPTVNTLHMTKSDCLTTLSPGITNTVAWQPNWYWTTYPPHCGCHCGCQVVEKKSIKELMIELKERLQEAQEEKEAARELRAELKKFITERMDG